MAHVCTSIYIELGLVNYLHNYKHQLFDIQRNIKINGFMIVQIMCVVLVSKREVFHNMKV